MQETPNNLRDLESYATEIFSPLLLLVPHNQPRPVCEALWSHVKKATLRQSALNQFTIELLNPLSERTQTITIHCVSGDPLDTDWDTTYELKNIEDSGHPCNTPRPPCLGKPEESPETYADKDQLCTAPLPTLRERLCFWRRPHNPQSSSKANQTPFPEDTEIKPLALLRSSLLISPDCRVYRVLIQSHSRVDESGRKILFLITLSFGRCGRGENTLSIRCQYGDRDGLIINIE